MGKIKPKGFIKVIFFLLVLSLLTTSTGCWNRRELDTLAIIVALGIDKSKENGEYILTSQIIKPCEIKAAGEKEKKGSGSGAVWTVISRGKTIFDAARNATAQSDRKLFFPHLKVIVIREEAAKAGVGSLVDLLDRDHEPRLLSWVFVAKGEAKEIIKAEHEQEKIPASALGRLVKAGGATSMAATINLLEFLKRISSKTTATFASASN
jgi:spore germination protein KC